MVGGGEAADLAPYWSRWLRPRGDEGIGGCRDARVLGSGCRVMTPLRRRRGVEAGASLKALRGKRG